MLDLVNQAGSPSESIETADTALWIFFEGTSTSYKASSSSWDTRFIIWNFNSSSPGPHYELSRLNRAYPDGDQSGVSDDVFYTEITDIQVEINKINANIDSMSRLHAKQIDAVELSGSYNTSQLESLTEETRTLSFALNRRIQTLSSQPVDARVARMRGPHLERVKERFKSAIERFQAEEKAYRDKTRERMARQYTIVKPDASPEEVQAVVESGQNQQIFANATTGMRYGQAQSAYNAVRDRHQELQRIEASLAELATLMTDMSLLVEQQGDVINNVQEKAAEAHVDIERGHDYTVKARIKAISYRKGRWICFVLFLIIIVIVVIVVVTQVT
ncbi:hypothetical protein ACEPAH_8735 [Sanghuangporus vaninii]